MVATQAEWFQRLRRGFVDYVLHQVIETESAITFSVAGTAAPGVT